MLFKVLEHTDNDYQQQSIFYFMRTIIFFLLFYFFSCSLYGEKIEFHGIETHDISSLQLWGPYSQRYAGISHIPKIEKGIRFDFSVIPGIYRNRQVIPHVLFESAYFPWEIDSDMRQITYRYELEWKDRVFVDVTYYILDEYQILVGMRCVNNTNLNQNLTLDLMSYIDYAKEYPCVKAENTDNLQWYSATNYVLNELAFKSCRYNLVYDGWKRNEERTSQSLDGSVLGKGFGQRKGDRVVYELNIKSGHKKGKICFRYNVPKGKEATFHLKGFLDTCLVMKGTGEYSLTSLPYVCTKPGKYMLELCSKGTSSVTLDGFFIGPMEEIDKLKIISAPLSFIPRIMIGKDKQDILIKYKDINNYYGIAWKYQESDLREILNDELESFFRRKTHNHVSRKLIGNRKGHYSDVFLRPIILSPRSEQTIYAMISTGNKEQVSMAIQQFHLMSDSLKNSICNMFLKNKTPRYLQSGKKYAFGHRLLQATLLSNIVYPIYTQGEYIRHFTPGKNWNSLYTWDSGFIALGLLNIDAQKAFECIKAYTTPIGNESAFVHHGTPLPIQIYAYHELWNQTQSNQMLYYLYPRLKQLFDFMIGKSPYSTTSMKSGLLRTWDYFYNSGGWDDYPPQKALYDKYSVVPVITSAYYIRAAKILRLVAKKLGKINDIKEYDDFIKRASKSLLQYSWDDESGYFGYVIHDNNGSPKDIYRYKDGSNFNKGIDGISPLIANISSCNQTRTMIKHIFSPHELWTEIGVSTVDQSAPYYRSDGYWNGTVWFPHQWTIWKALLDLGEGEKAYQIAKTALDTWEKECLESYFTFEHFVISSKRGAGWHQFSGLSSPILNWFSSYYQIGKVSTGFEVCIDDSYFNRDYSRYEAILSFDDSETPHKRTILVCMNPSKKYKVIFKGDEISYKTYHLGLLEITLPITNEGGRLNIISNEK